MPPAKTPLTALTLAASMEPDEVLSEVRFPVWNSRSGFSLYEFDCCDCDYAIASGSSGECTVLVYGDAVRSCLLFAVQTDGMEVTTVEGIASPDECHSVQCGFCTPGFVMSLTAVLRDHPNLAEDETREGFSGNFCRCTGYQGIVAAAHRAAECRRRNGNALPSTPFQKRVTAVTCVVPCVI